MNIKKLLFKFKSILINKDSLRVDSALEFNSTLSKNEIENLTLIKLKKILLHAKQNVPFYASSFTNINLNEFNTLSDLEKLPILSKSDINNNFNKLIANNISKSRLQIITTGGSTGVPLKLLHDKKFPIMVNGWRTFRWWGVKPYDNIAFIYRKTRTGLLLQLNSLLWYPTKRSFLDASLMSEISMRKFYIEICKSKPTILQGYVGAVFEFAKFIQSNNLNINFLKAVWVTSAPLINSQRQIMESILNAPVYDQYGCSEVFWLASECKEQKGLHIYSDIRHIEILRDDNTASIPGEYGDIAITDLENYAFPLIRYKNGDRGRLIEKKCRCGLSFPLLDTIKGRVTDNIKLPSGNTITGDYLTTIFDDAPEAIEQFQIYQFKNYTINLKCVPTNHIKSIEICEQKTRALQDLTKNEVKINLEIVNKIYNEEGKTRYIISEIK